MQMDVWKIGQSAFDYCDGSNDAASYSFFYQFRLIVLTCAMNPVIGVSTEGLFPCVTRSVHFLGWVPPLCTYLNAANHQLRVAHQLNSIC